MGHLDHAAADGDHGHDHSHIADHDHPHGRWQRLSHVSEVFGSHSHHAADQVDTALEADQDGRRALWLSLAGLAVTAGVQAAVVVLSGSVALLGDTLHNVADALTAVPLLVAFRLARRPANNRYTYGYGRAEDLAGLFVVAMIALSTGLAAYTAIDRLLNPRDVTHLWAVAAAALVGFVGN
jgi:divalent metal cation (Fe/Co/Zn/Cd) transporter